ncbi:MAG: T9SS type A sorting domain-containing protein [Flavobacteriaceae bacterium]|nr:T9SS type A sorting domain-containing protein [Flavobacteriaceae bacterium]
MKKKYLFILTLSLTALAFSQDKWQNMMYDHENNFYDIQKDFNIYYESVMKGQSKIPKGAGIKQFKRWEYYWEARVDENGNFPPAGNTLTEIKKYFREHQNNNTSNKSYDSGTGTWEIVGPTPLPSNGTGQLNGSGRLTCITFHPTDPNTIFVGAPSGGIWKTTDNGLTWTEFSGGLTRLGVSSIVIHPTTPDIMYIATGDRDSYDAPGYGVWKSIDGGVIWNPHNSTMGNRTINELIMDPTDPDKMLATATNGYVYRTSNGGTTWTASNFTGVNLRDIVYHPTNSSIVYAAGSEVHKSTDGGATFTEITSGVPTTAQRIALAVSPNQPNWVYLLAGDGSGLVGIYRSIDSGENYLTRTTTPNIMGYEIDGSDTRGQSSYDIVIAADPTDANNIYTGGVNMWKSTNGGTTMTCMSYWVGASGGVDGVHADQHALEFSPYTNNLYSGNDGGLYTSTNNGINWSDLSSGLAIAQVYKIGVSQTTNGLVINGYQDNGTAISRDDSFRTEIGGDGMECEIDPTDANYIYGALYYGDIRRSTDNGNSFSQIAVDGVNGIDEAGSWVTPYKLDPNTPARMLVGYDNVWRSNDVKTPAATAVVWTKISTFSGTSNIRDLAIAPSNSDVVYVSRYDNKLYRSDNATSGSPTWTDLGGSLPVANEPEDIEIDPTDPTHLFIALSNNIYESTNSGGSWTDVSGTLPNISLNTIVIDKTSSVDAMYVGMDVGVYYKDNNQADWTLYKTNLPNLEITELEIQYGTEVCENKLYAGTYGQGLWKSDLKDPGNLAPVACFDVNTTTGCVGNTFLLRDYTAFTPTSWSWTITPTTFNYSGGTDASFQNPQVQFTATGTYTIALTVTNATNNDTETKPSYITVSAGAIATTFNDDFEAETVCGATSDCGTTTCVLSGSWNNLTNGTDDEIDWRVDIGGTPSTATGPSVDYNPGSGSGKYIYTEGSSCFGSTAILESNCLSLDVDYDFEFAYHMYGSSVGSLHVDIFSAGNWINDIITPYSGDQGGDVWKLKTIDLSAYTGQVVKLRFRAITGTSHFSDIALDDIKFTAQVVLNIEDNYLFEEGVGIYPNPAKNVLNIINPSNLKLNTVVIYDITGRKILTTDLSDMGTEKSINIQSLQSAVYIVTINDDTNQITKRLIKK